MASSEKVTWGAMFYPPVSKDGLGTELELPIRTRRARDSYDIEAEYGRDDTGEVSSTQSKSDIPAE